MSFVAETYRLARRRVPFISNLSPLISQPTIWLISSTISYTTYGTHLSRKTVEQSDHPRWRISFFYMRERREEKVFREYRRSYEMFLPVFRECLCVWTFQWLYLVRVGIVVSIWSANYQLDSDINTLSFFYFWLSVKCE